MGSANYRILWKGQITGPFSREKVEEMLAKNEIGVWAEISEGNSDWKPISDWRERKAVFKAAPANGSSQSDPAAPRRNLKIEPGSTANQATPDLPPLPHGGGYQSAEPNTFSGDYDYANHTPKDGFYM